MRSVNDPMSILRGNCLPARDLSCYVRIRKFSLATRLGVCFPRTGGSLFIEVPLEGNSGSILSFV